MVYFWSSGRQTFLTNVGNDSHGWAQSGCLFIRSFHPCPHTSVDGHVASVFIFNLMNWFYGEFFWMGLPLTLLLFSEFGKMLLPRWFCCGRSRPRDFSSAPSSTAGAWPSSRLPGAWSSWRRCSPWGLTTSLVSYGNLPPSTMSQFGV